MKYKVEYSKTNDTYRVMGGDKIVTDFATKERADAEAKRLNSLQSVKDVDKAQEKKSLKEKIQELSLDQKAKLYFMGLVRQGKIDTLPEDPTAAYIRDMMDKEDPKMDPAIRSDFDEPVFENDKDDYGRSVSGKDKRTFMEPEDSMPATRAKKMAQAAYDKAEMNGDIRGMELALAAMDIDKPIPGLNKRLKEIATELGYLEEMKVTDKEGNDVTSDIIKKLEKSLEDSGYKITKGYSSDADIRPGYKTRPVKEVDGMEGGIDLNENLNESKVDITYTDPGDRFYKMKVDGKTIKREEGTKYLKGLGIVDDKGKDMEIPRSYNETILDKIVDKLKEKGIDADYNNAFDPS